jgi:hypothetical protein
MNACAVCIRGHLIQNVKCVIHAMNNDLVVIPGRMTSNTKSVLDLQMLNIQIICSFRHYKQTPLSQILDTVLGHSDIERWMCQSLYITHLTHQQLQQLHNLGLQSSVCLGNYLTILVLLAYFLRISGKRKNESADTSDVKFRYHILIKLRKAWNN